MNKSYRSLITISAYTLLSRGLGFVRDLIIARTFGIESGIEAFLVAFKLPNLLRRLFVEGTFALGLVPVLSKHQQQGANELQQFVHHLVGALLVFLIPATIITILIAPGMVAILAPGFITDPQRFWLTNEMLQIMAPYLPLIILTACAGAILQSLQHFWITAFVPVLLNICLIIAAWWGQALLPHQPIIVLAWGAVLAGIIQLILSIVSLSRLRISLYPRFAPKILGLHHLWQILSPAMLGTSVVQLNFILDNLLLSFLPIGSIAWLYYANRLIEFPQGILGAALGTVILSNLSNYWAQQDVYNFAKTLERAIRLNLLLGLPAAVGLWILAKPIMATLFQSENFTLKDVNMSAASLQAYAIGLPAYLMVKILIPVYYAKHTTQIPVRIAIITGIINLILSLILMWPLAHVGLAWSSSIATIINAAWLWYNLINNNIHISKNWLKLLTQIGLACVAMAWILVLEIQKNLAVLIIEGSLVYGASLILLGLQIQHVHD